MNIMYEELIEMIKKWIDDGFNEWMNRWMNKGVQLRNAWLSKLQGQPELELIINLLIHPSLPFLQINS